MLDLKKLSESFWVSPQIEVADVEKLAQLGVKTIINNRPEAESDDQPHGWDIGEAAKKNGIEYFYLPITGSLLPRGQIERFQNIIVTAPGPILGFCKSGTRSVRIWAMCMAKAKPAWELVKTASNIGYDISALEPKLIELSQ